LALLALSQLCLACDGSADGAIVLQEDTDESADEHTSRATEDDAGAEPLVDAATADAAAEATPSSPQLQDAATTDADHAATTSSDASNDAGSAAPSPDGAAVDLDWGATARCVHHTPPGDAEAIALGTDAGAPEGGPHVTLLDS